jgi:hypothetical protein
MRSASVSQRAETNTHSAATENGASIKRGSPLVAAAGVPTPLDVLS